MIIPERAEGVCAVMHTRTAERWSDIEGVPVLRLRHAANDTLSLI
jgi:hypothetical protein